MKNRNPRNPNMTHYSSADKLWALNTASSFAVKSGDIP